MQLLQSYAPVIFFFQTATCQLFGREIC